MHHWLPVKIWINTFPTVITTDHECSNILEALEKKMKGMKIMVRDGSSVMNMEGLFNIEEGKRALNYDGPLNLLFRDLFEKDVYYSLFDFIVSDDKHPNDLIKGHLNASVKKAMSYGVHILKAIHMVTINPGFQYKLNCGAIMEGLQADFVIVDSIYDCNVLGTYIGGECVFDGENVLFDIPEFESKNTMNVSLKTARDFDICYDGDECEVNVIECTGGDLLTKKTTAKLPVKNGVVQADILQDVLKIAVVERYGGNTVANGFIKGFGMKKGAIASSIAHDSHNIIVVGYNSDRMAKAVNKVIENKGGIAVYSVDFEDSLLLPIAGLMSNEDAYVVAKKLADLHEMVRALGCTLESPFMTMAFMALLVIPSIKISDKGLFDGDSFEFMEVIRN